MVSCFLFNSCVEDWISYGIAVTVRARQDEGLRMASVSVIFKSRHGHFTPLLRIFLMAAHCLQDEDVRPASIFLASELTGFLSSKCPASSKILPAFAPTILYHTSMSVVFPFAWHALPCFRYSYSSFRVQLHHHLLCEAFQLPPLQQNLVFSSPYTHISTRPLLHHFIM